MTEHTITRRAALTVTAAGAAAIVAGTAHATAEDKDRAEWIALWLDYVRKERADDELDAIADGLTSLSAGLEINQLYFTLEQFGGGVDKTGEENNAAYTAAEATGVSTANGDIGPTIRLEQGVYHFADSIQIKRCVTIIGQSSSLAGGAKTTSFRWTSLPAGKSGIYINRHNTLGEDVIDPTTTRGNGSQILNLHLRGPGGVDYTGTQHGIRLHARCRLSHVWIEKFPADGISIQTKSGVSNANTFTFDNIFCDTNGRHGLFLDGADVNAGTVIAFNGTNNGGWGIYDSSFLGNSYFGGHFNGNGDRSKTNHNGLRYYMISDDPELGTTTEPGTDDTVWFFRGPGEPVIDNWPKAEGYIRGGGVYSDNANARCVFVGHYFEGGQPGSQISSRSTYIPAMDGAGVSGAGLSIRAREINNAKITDASELSVAEGANEGWPVTIKNTASSTNNGRSAGVQFTASFLEDEETPRIVGGVLGVARGGTGPTARHAAALTYYDHDLGEQISGFEVNGDEYRWLTKDDDTWDIGKSSRRMAATYSREFRPGSGTPIWTSGEGSPEGVVAAAAGSLYTDQDGGRGTTLYIKQSGSGSSTTGWGTGELVRVGEGTPEGSVAAPIGTLYTRSDGGAGTTLYVKEIGSGNTGWVAK